MDMSTPYEGCYCPSASHQMSPFPSQLNSWNPLDTNAAQWSPPFLFRSVVGVSKLWGLCLNVLEKQPCQILWITHLFSKGLPSSVKPSA